MNSYVKQSAFDLALYYISFKDRTKREVIIKLKEKGYDDIEINSAIEKLSEYRYLDDKRYAEKYYNSMSSRKGKRLIRAELLKKGISKEEIESACDNCELEEEETINHIISKKYSPEELADEKAFRRAYGYFLRRGFESNLIIQFLSKYRKTD